VALAFVCHYGQHPTCISVCTSKSGGLPSKFLTDFWVTRLTLHEVYLTTILLVPNDHLTPAFNPSNNIKYLLFHQSGSSSTCLIAMASLPGLYRSWSSLTAQQHR
jgi:hypothetical protein